MPVTIVAGAQWGDEGKGKIVDLLAQDADIVMRSQGGPNAGHTIVNEYGKFALHGLPSGIFSARARCLIGAGCVVNPVSLASEARTLNVDSEKLLISERAHVIMPYHVQLDELDDDARPAHLGIGSTGQGIAPAYADKAGRIGIRMGDLRNLRGLRERIELALTRNNAILERVHGRSCWPVDAILAEIGPAADALLPYVGDTTAPVSSALATGQRILLEGQLGVMRDIDWGPYPFVTSSSPTPAGIAAAAGVPMGAIDRIVGVCKAYVTSVGDGPFPTEATSPTRSSRPEEQLGDYLRERGGENGATTGRPRRCGWLDLPALKWACDIAGFTEMAVTKLDVLDELDDIPVCVQYADGSAAPRYKSRRGWSRPTSTVRAFEDLPADARAYIEAMEQFVSLRVRMVSVGPDRDATILRP
jgi:adenylosuccinate synthase